MTQLRNKSSIHLTSNCIEEEHFVWKPITLQQHYKKFLNHKSLSDIRYIVKVKIKNANTVRAAGWVASIA